MRAIIIEDEQSAANRLLTALDRINAGIKISAVYSDPAEAIDGIKALKPELVFLDVNLNHGINGFAILDKVKDYKFKVIFTTAIEQYALAAFEYNAVQFLLYMTS